MARPNDRHDRSENRQEDRDRDRGSRDDDGWSARRRNEGSDDPFALRRPQQQADRTGSQNRGADWDQGERDRGGYGQGYNRTDTGGGYRASLRGYGDDRRQSGGADGERGFVERAGDEVSSWFGDEGARQRRNMGGHRGKGPKGYTRSDDRIREDVNDGLSDDDGVDASDIEVSVQGGEVTLTGEVASRQEKRMAEDCVERVAGVAHVQNNLRARQPVRREGETGKISAGSSSAGPLGSAQTSTGTTI